MKRELKFYQYWFAPMNFKYPIFGYSKWFPKFDFSKNVQGWFYTRKYTLSWLKWALTYTISLNSDFSVSRNLAHEMNVKKYMA